MAFPSRWTTTRALPASSSSGLARVGDSHPTRYREAARHVWGGLKTAGTTARSHATRARVAAGSALARAQGRPESIGGIFARAFSPGLAVGGLGVIDGTPWGHAFTAFTNGLIEPSTALALLGTVGRATGWDRRFLGKHVERLNVNVLTGMFPVAMYKLGRALPGAAMRGFQGFSKSPAKVAGAPLGGAPTGKQDAAIQVETVPGEATQA